MCIHQRVLSKSYPMNTNTTGFRPMVFKNPYILVLWTKVAGRVKDVSIIRHSPGVFSVSTYRMSNIYLTHTLETYISNSSLLSIRPACETVVILFNSICGGQLGYVIKLSVAWAQAVVFAGSSCLHHCLQLASHALATVWQKK